MRTEPISQMGWLVISQALDGKHCIYCGWRFNSREAVVLRDPAYVGLNDKGAMDYACAECFEHAKKGAEANHE